jgi:CRP-like cAMP-binding protein
MDSKLEMLRRVPLFANLGDRQLREVEALADEIDVPAGKVLCQEGQRGEEFFVIVDGTVALTRQGRDLPTLGPGQFIGEIALVDGGPRTATATTTTPARLLVLAHREFNSLLDRFPEIESTVLRTLASRVRQLDPEAAH